MQFGNPVVKGDLPILARNGFHWETRNAMGGYQGQFMLVGDKVSVCIGMHLLTMRVSSSGIQAFETSLMVVSRLSPASALAYIGRDKWALKKSSWILRRIQGCYCLSSEFWGWEIWWGEGASRSDGHWNVISSEIVAIINSEVRGLHRWPMDLYDLCYGTRT